MPGRALDGTVVVFDLSMTEHPSRRRNTLPILRWIFRRGNQALTCQVVRGAGYTVALIPHGSPVRTSVETFETSLSAFRHHAAIALQLREFGWTLASYGR